MESLFEKLSGHYADGTPVSAVPTQQREIKSIQDHLERLLNTRKGMLIHMPEYGLSDVSGLFRRLPASAEELMVEIQEVITRFEPRLSSIRVSIGEFEPGSSRISFRISAVTTRNGRITIDSSFFPTGRGQVRISGTHG